MSDSKNSPMSPEHRRIFQTAARLYGVYIIVRQTNALSLPYIGKDGFSPKPLDCKAKTAEVKKVMAINGLQSNCGGLVVSPEIFGMAAYRNENSYQSAMKSWNMLKTSGIHPEMNSWEVQKERLYAPDESKRFFVDLNPESERYGCVKFMQTGQIRAATYIHGDFDLFAVIDIEKRDQNTAVFEEMLGQHHSRSPKFRDVQYFVNSRIGTPMIQHGEEESYSDHLTKDDVEIFFPNGDWRALQGPNAVRDFYAEMDFHRRSFAQQDRESGAAGTFTGYITA